MCVGQTLRDQGQVTKIVVNSLPLFFRRFFLPEHEYRDGKRCHPRRRKSTNFARPMPKEYSPRKRGRSCRLPNFSPPRNWNTNILQWTSKIKLHINAIETFFLFHRTNINFCYSKKIKNSLFRQSFLKTYFSSHTELRGTLRNVYFLEFNFLKFKFNSILPFPGSHTWM